MSGLSFLLFIIFDHKVDEYGRILRLWDFPRTSPSYFCSNPQQKSAKQRHNVLSVGYLCLYNFTRLGIVIETSPSPSKPMTILHFPTFCKNVAELWVLIMRSAQPLPIRDPILVQMMQHSLINASIYFLWLHDQTNHFHCNNIRAWKIPKTYKVHRNVLLVPNFSGSFLFISMGGLIAWPLSPGLVKVFSGPESHTKNVPILPHIGFCAAVLMAFFFQVWTKNLCCEKKMDMFIFGVVWKKLPVNIILLTSPLVCVLSLAYLYKNGSAAEI